MLQNLAVSGAILLISVGAGKLVGKGVKKYYGIKKVKNSRNILRFLTV